MPTLQNKKNTFNSNALADGISVPKLIPSSKKEICRLNLTYIQANRLTACLYKPIMNELYESAFPMTAEVLQHFINREGEMIKKGDRRLCDDKNLFIKIIDNGKLAEKIWLTNSDIASRLKAIQQIFEILLILDNELDNVYQWVVYEGVSVLLNVLEDDLFKDSAYNYMKAKVLCKFAGTRLKKDDTIEGACKALGQAFELVLGQDWQCDKIKNAKKSRCNDLHTEITLTMAEAYQKQAMKLCTPDTGEIALRYLKDAVLALGTLDLNNFENRCVYYNGLMLEANCYIALKQQAIAMEKIQQLRKIFEKNENPQDIKKFLCNLLRNEGDCLQSENKWEEACLKYLDAHEICVKYDYKDITADVCIMLGRTFRRLNRFQLSEFAFQRAELLLKELGDHMGVKKIKYHKADAEAARLMPKLVKLIDSKKHSDYLALMSWKFQLKPFWQTEIRLGSFESANSTPHNSVPNIESPNDENEEGFFDITEDQRKKEQLELIEKKLINEKWIEITNSS